MNKISYPDVPHAMLMLWEEAVEDYYDELRDEIQWSQGHNVMFGKTVKQPRLSAWYGDEGSKYRFSGVERNPLPWTDRLLSLKRWLDGQLGTNFNSALANWYRDGKDYIGFHSDDERELGPNPIIASLSFGAERALVMKHRRGQYPDHTIWLPPGSLFLMFEETQRNWKHGIEKSNDSNTGGRINITFRNIME